MSVFYNNALIGASGQAAGGYQIQRSLRFNPADSSFLSRTPASAGNRKTWTWAGWVKRSVLNTDQLLISTSDGSSNTTSLGFTSGNAIELYQFTSASYAGRKITSAVYRDVSAWMHIVAVWDTTNATPGDRIRLYVNGVRVDNFSTSSDPSQNSDSRMNQTVEHNIARTSSNGGIYYLNGYLADVHFIDGQALTPTSFGEFDTNNIWQPKAYSGTYGTNGFKLDFADNSAATATTLGKDTSGNGNNWTPNNLSVTAGVGNDSLVDSPTNYGTDTGAGGEVRGNYATLNPLSNTSGRATLSDGNLQTTGSGVDWESVFSTFAFNSGKWYIEATMSAAGDGQAMIGVCKDSDVSSVISFLCGSTANSYGYYSSTGKTFNNTSGPGVTYGASYGLNDVIGVALNMDAGTLTFYKNGVSQGQAYSGLSGTYFFCLSTVTNTWVVNFGQRPFAYTAPSGFKALCTANLPAPTIPKPSTVMDVVTYTGTGSTLTPTSSLGFSPDLVWIKSRSAATDHTLYDAVRGAQARLESNNTDAEVTSDNGLTAFNSNGFTLGTLAQVNTNAATYAGWCWDAGSSTVTNTSGTISSQVRANASAGFSIVTYTGTGANATVGHGLGVAPRMVIVKRRNVAADWAVWHTSIAATNYLLLNSTIGSTSGTTYWNSTSPTSTVFSVGTATNTNANTGTYVAFCFASIASYNSFGSYVGNGSADGPFVYTGFRPRWLLWRASDGGYNWRIIDTARDQYNTSGLQLYPDTAGAEGDYRSSLGIDLLSNGFKLRNASYENTNGVIYIYAAFAESPFALARAR